MHSQHRFHNDTLPNSTGASNGIGTFGFAQEHQQITNLRHCASKPRVATQELPWVIRAQIPSTATRLWQFRFLVAQDAPQPRCG